jgi:hypothetical protein
MNTFIYVNGRPDHQKGQHDDLIMGISMAIYVGESSFQKLEKVVEKTKMMIESSLEKIIQEQKPEKIIMTGGDRQLVSQMINSSTPVDLIPHLVHLGLSQIHQNLVSLKLI